ncbi:MAG: endonuclease/exonuclease/phosphatase family protein [Opitutaceae bacterium]|nr:endonuclease/exonuclease/phosphatase family protein [Opitutaceae bacterium]
MKPVAAWRRRARSWFAVLVVGYALAVALGLVVTAWVGERHWATGLMLFAPPLLWLAPAAVLAVPALFLSRRLVLVLGAAAAMVAYYFADMGWSSPNVARGRSYTVVSNNTGDRDLDRLIALVKEVRADIVLLQDSTRTEARKLQREVGMAHVSWIGEFLIITRFPVLKARKSDVPSDTQVTPAAWFELDCDGHTLAVCSVHLPTPRHEFLRLRGKGILSSEARQSVAEAVKHRLRVARELADEIAAEKRPVIVAGDFNAPAQGHVRRIFSERLSDCFAAAGSGNGLTFPGRSNTPFDWSGRWLRIDYVFAGPGVRPLAARAEPHGRAQHMAVVARFELSSSK